MSLYGGMNMKHQCMGRKTYIDTCGVCPPGSSGEGGWSQGSLPIPISPLPVPGRHRPATHPCSQTHPGRGVPHSQPICGSRGAGGCGRGEGALHQGHGSCLPQACWGHRCATSFAADSLHECPFVYSCLHLACFISTLGS